MGLITFHRPKRVNPPAMPRGDLLLESPPEIPPPAASKPFGNVLRMLPMMAGGLAMGLMLTSGGMAGRGVMQGVVSGLYAVSMMGMMLKDKTDSLTLRVEGGGPAGTPMARCDKVSRCSAASKGSSSIMA